MELRQLLPMIGVIYFFILACMDTSLGPSIKDVRTRGGRGLVKSGHMRTQGGEESVEKNGRSLNSNFYQNFLSLNSVLCAKRQHSTQ